MVLEHPHAFQEFPIGLAVQPGNGFLDVVQEKDEGLIWAALGW
jgi:hypothetical protein